MADIMTLSVLLRLRDEASAGLRNISDQAKTVGVSMQNAGKQMALAGGAMTAAFGLMAKGALATDSIRQSFEGLSKTANLSSQELLNALDSAAKGTISTASLMQTANRAMAMGVGKSLTDMTELMEIARVAGKQMGLDTTQAFNDIVTGIGRGSPLILDNLGFIVSLEEANQKYAASLGKVATDLTETEKKQALFNAVVEDGRRRIADAGGDTLTAKDAMQQFQVALKNASDEIGAALIPSLTKTLQLLTPLIEGFKNLPKPIMTAIPIVAGLGAALFGVGTALYFAGTAIKTIGPAIALLTNPIALVVAALGVLTVAWFTDWGNMRDFHASVVNSMRQKTADFVNNSIRDFNLVITGINGLIKALNFVSKEQIPLIPKINIEIIAEDAKKEFDDFAAKVTAPLQGFNDEMAKLEIKAGEAAKSFETFNTSISGIVPTLGDMETAFGSLRASLKPTTNEIDTMIQSLRDIAEARGDSEGFLTHFNNLLREASRTAEATGLSFEKTLRLQLIKDMDDATARVTDMFDAFEDGQDILRLLDEAGFSLAEKIKFLSDAFAKGTLQMKPLSDGLRGVANDFDEVGHAAIFAKGQIDKAKDAFIDMTSTFSQGFGTQTDLDIAKNVDVGLFPRALESVAQRSPGGLEKLQAFRAGETSPELQTFIEGLIVQARGFIAKLSGSTISGVGIPLDVQQRFNEWNRILSPEAMATVIDEYKRRAQLAAGIEPPTGPSSMGMPRMAEGGQVMRGGLALVGERGREVVSLPRGAEVRPLQPASTDNEGLMKMLVKALQSLKRDPIVFNLNGRTFAEVLGNSATMAEQVRSG